MSRTPAVPGFCAGLALPMAVVPGRIPLDDYPVIRTLAEPGGLEKLVSDAREKGFAPNPTYSSACHLCAHARAFLLERDPTPDLAPAGFYETWAEA